MTARNFIRKVTERISFLLTPVTKVYPQIVTLSPNELLKGRNALITGGTSGIGFQIAKAFACSGAHVVITGRKSSKVEQAVDKLRTLTNSENIFGIDMDMRDVEGMKKKLDAAMELTGACFDILVNNAGVNGCSFNDGTESDFDNILETNLKGVFFLSRLVARLMKRNELKGNILNMASSSSLRPAASAYTLSKWGVRGLTQGLAITLAPYNIVVNGIAPGPTITPMMVHDDNMNDISLSSNLTGRYALPEEIANMAVILVSDMGRMIVGDIVYMTGGSGLIYNGDVNYTFA